MHRVPAECNEALKHLLDELSYKFFAAPGRFRVLSESSFLNDLIEKPGFAIGIVVVRYADGL